MQFVDLILQLYSLLHSIRDRIVLKLQNFLKLIIFQRILYLRQHAIFSLQNQSMRTIVISQKIKILISKYLITSLNIIQLIIHHSLIIKCVRLIILTVINTTEHPGAKVEAIFGWPQATGPLTKRISFFLLAMTLSFDELIQKTHNVSKLQKN